MRVVKLWHTLPERW